MDVGTSSYKLPIVHIQVHHMFYLCKDRSMHATRQHHSTMQTNTTNTIESNKILLHLQQCLETHGILSNEANKVASILVQHHTQQQLQVIANEWSLDEFKSRFEQEIPAKMTRSIALEALKMWNNQTTNATNDTDQTTTAEMTRGKKAWSSPYSNVDTPSATLQGHTNGLTTLDFSPDASRLYTASLDGRIGVWSIPSGELIGWCEGHSDQVLCAAVSPFSDGEFIVSGGLNAELILWDSRSRVIKKKMSWHDDNIYCVCFLPSACVASGDSGGIIIIASFESNTNEFVLQSRIIAGSEIGNHVSSIIPHFHDSLKLLAGTETGIMVFDITTGNIITTFEKTTRKSSVDSIVYNSTFDAVFAGSYEDGVLLYHNASSGQLVKKIEHIHDGKVLCVATFRSLVASSGGDGNIRVWSLPELILIKEILHAKTEWVWCITFHPFGGSLYSGATDDLIKVFEE
jgi:WD40 repeat protein